MMSFKKIMIKLKTIKSRDVPIWLEDPSAWIGCFVIARSDSRTIGIDSGSA